MSAGSVSLSKISNDIPSLIKFALQTPRAPAASKCARFGLKAVSSNARKDAREPAALFFVCGGVNKKGRFRRR
jgi:hypothetical protein